MRLSGLDTVSQNLCDVRYLHRRVIGQLLDINTRNHLQTDPQVHSAAQAIPEDI